MPEPIDIGAKRQTRQQRAEAKAKRPPTGERAPKAPPTMDESQSSAGQAPPMGETWNTWDTPGNASSAVPPPTAEQVTKKRTAADRKLAVSIASTYQTIGMGAIGVGMRMGDAGIQGVGVTTVNMAEALAESWLDVADANPRVKKALQKFTEVSATGSLIGLHVAVLVPLLIDRKIIPGDFAVMAANMAGTSAPQQNGNGAHN